MAIRIATSKPTARAIDVDIATAAAAATELDKFMEWRLIICMLSSYGQDDSRSCLQILQEVGLRFLVQEGTRRRGDWTSASTWRRGGLTISCAGAHQTHRRLNFSQRVQQRCAYY